MKEFSVKILKSDFINPDVKLIRTEKPQGYKFLNGQATQISINKPELKEDRRPFSFASLNEDNYLEFVIKIYKEHHGVTEKIGNLDAGDELIITEPFGKLTFRGNGIFIAGGAGIMPFVSILRELEIKNRLKGNTLIFSNKEEKDIILKNEFERMRITGLRVLFTLTRENNPKYENKRIDRGYLEEKIPDFRSQFFYICGPPKMVNEMRRDLINLGVEPGKIVIMF